jgi:hypothetical protein
MFTAVMFGCRIFERAIDVVVLVFAGLPIFAAGRIFPGFA